MTKCFFKSMFIYKNVQYNEMTSKNWMRKYSQEKNDVRTSLIVTGGTMYILSFDKTQKTTAFIKLCLVTDLLQVFLKILSPLPPGKFCMLFHRLLIIFKNQLF